MSGGLGLLANAAEIGFAFLVSTAAFAIYRNKGQTLAEAGSYGLLTMLMLQSWLAQVLLYVGGQHLLVWAQLLLLPGAAGIAGRHGRLLRRQLPILLRFAKTHWLAAGSMLLGWTYLAAHWWWRAGIAHQALTPYGRGFLACSGSILTARPPEPPHVLTVLNHAILLSPWQSAAAPAIANLGAYMCIGLATYALARRYAWPPTAITVSLLVISMPRLAHQSLVVYSELLPAAAALTAILALYRAVEQPQARDMTMLAAAVAFSVGGGRLCYVLPLVLAAMSLLVLARRHDIRLLLQAVRGRPLSLLASVAMILVFSQAAVIAANLYAGRPWIGELAPDAIRFNDDGLVGAGANMVRYLLQSIYLPKFIDNLTRWAFGFSGLAGLKLFYQWAVASLVDGRGAAAAFELSWTTGLGGGWFGPVGFLLVLPALGKSLWRGPSRLKTTAQALAAYWVLISLIAAWQPTNVRLMTAFFVCCGFCMAFFLPPWHLGRKGRLTLQLLGVLMLIVDMLP